MAAEVKSRHGGGLVARIFGQREAPPGASVPAPRSPGAPAPAPRDGEAAEPSPERAPEIRRRRAQDLRACGRLLGLVAAEGQYPVDFPDAPLVWLDEDTQLAAWVAESDGRILGHVALARVGDDPVERLRWREPTTEDPDDLAVVSRLFVRPSAQGRGIGGALLDTAAAEARARGLIPVTEVVSASRDGVRLFTDRGWRLFGMEPWGPRRRRLTLYRFLPPDFHAP